MKQVLTGSMILVVTVIMLSCGPKPQPVPPVPTPEEEGYKATYTPPWWHADSCQTTEEYLCQRTTMESKDQQFAVNKATTEARSQLQAQLEAKLELLVRGFVQEVGLGQDAEFRTLYTQTIKEISFGVIRGSVPWRQEARINDQRIYRAWVGMKLLLNDAYLAHLNAIKSNEHLYTRFQESEAFKIHEEEMEKFEQYKKDQGY